MSAVACFTVSAVEMAVIIAVPADTPRMSPSADTVATAALLVRQCMAWEMPASAVRRTSSWRVSPVKIVATAGLRMRSRTTGRTTTTAVLRRVVSATDSTVIRVLPTDTPITVPFAETVAMAGFSLRHESAVLRPGSSCTMALNRRCSPVPNESEDGARVMLPAEVTVTRASAAIRGLPTAETRSMVVPGATPVITPCAFTAATDGCSDSQARSNSAPASASTVGCKGNSAPMTTDSVCGARESLRTVRTPTSIATCKSPVCA